MPTVTDDEAVKALVFMSDVAGRVRAGGITLIEGVAELVADGMNESDARDFLANVTT